MSVVYINFEIQFHGLNITQQEEIDAIKMKLDEAACKAHPARRNGLGPRGLPLDSDVEVKMMERAGLLNEES